MAEATAPLSRRESVLIRAIKSIALLRESPVGMIGAGIILFWVLVAIVAEVAIPQIVISFALFGKSYEWVIVAERIVLFTLSPLPPNATFIPRAAPGTELILEAGRQFASQPVEEVCRAVGAAGDKYYCGTFWFGADNIGRDVLSRVIHGTRPVLFYGVLATVCAYAVGVPMGLAAGYLRGVADEILSFVANVILSFPVLVLYVIIIATIGASPTNIVIAVTFASAPGIMRIVRGLVLDLRNREYVSAAQTRGESSARIMFVEILPNARGPLIVDSCLRLGYVIITIGVLGFLGLGLPPPDPNWGSMIADTRQYATSYPHMAAFPALAISSLVLGFNLLADGLREVSLRD